MSAQELFEEWLEKATDSDIANELLNMKGDEKAINEAFSKELSFGTAGLRAKMGAGTSKINRYTVIRSVLGIMRGFGGGYSKKIVAVIGYDSRNNSQAYANLAATVLKKYGVTVHLAEEPIPTPAVSHFVRRFMADFGINFTASHNTYEYNGIKVYNSSGSQVSKTEADRIFRHISDSPYFGEDCNLTENIEGCSIIDERELKGYTHAVLKEGYLKGGACNNISVAYTPLNGAGRESMKAIFRAKGVDDLYLVKEQLDYDGNFPTCKYPNPEHDEALHLVTKLMKEEKCDIAIATDPDADRMVCIVNLGDNGYKKLSGNEIAMLLLIHVLEKEKKRRTLPSKPILIKSLVSSPLADEIIKKYSGETIHVLTGFKYVADKLDELERTKKINNFIFAYEESYGYLKGNYTHDKDAILASMLIIELASELKKEEKTLVDEINLIYEQYGYLLDDVMFYEFEGNDSMEKMERIMEKFREEFAGHDYMIDYKTGEGVPKEWNLPKSDMVEFELNSKISFIVRPSGTEPKLKIYLFVREESPYKATKLLEGLRVEIDEFIKS